MTHCGKSFELKRSAWAYINNTPVSLSEAREATERCPHVTPRPQDVDRRDLDCLVCFPTKQETASTVTVVVKDGTVCEPNE